MAMKYLVLCVVLLPTSAFMPTHLGLGREGRSVRVAASKPGNSGNKLLDLDSFDINNLLLQRSIQGLCAEFDSIDWIGEKRWLGGFLGHSHLTSWAHWHGVIGVRVPWLEYFRTLLNSLPEDRQATLNAVIGASEPPENAAPLRAYLPASGLRLTPRETGELLLELCSTLGDEWASDLEALAALDSREDRAKREERRGRLQDIVRAAKKKGEFGQPHDMALALLKETDGDPTRQLAKRISAEAERLDRVNVLKAKAGVSPEELAPPAASVLRLENLDLLQRAATCVALRTFQAELSVDAVSQDAKVARAAGRTLVWFNANVLEPWLPVLCSADVLASESGRPGSFPCHGKGPLDPTNDKTAEGSAAVDKAEGEAESTEEEKVKKYVSEIKKYTSEEKEKGAADQPSGGLSWRLLHGLSLRPPVMVGSHLVDPNLILARLLDHREAAAMGMKLQVGAKTRVRINELRREGLERSLTVAYTAPTTSQNKMPEEA